MLTATPFTSNFGENWDQGFDLVYQTTFIKSWLARWKAECMIVHRQSNAQSYQEENLGFQKRDFCVNMTSMAHGKW